MLKIALSSLFNLMNVNSERAFDAFYASVSFSCQITVLQRILSLLAASESNT